MKVEFLAYEDQCQHENPLQRGLTCDLEKDHKGGHQASVIFKWPPLGVAKWDIKL